MRTIATTLTALGCTAALVTASPDYSVRTRDTSDTTLHFAGGGVHTLDLRTINGTIHVAGDGGSDVRVTASRTVDAEDDAAAADGLREIALDTKDSASTIGLIVRDPHHTSCGESGVGQSEAWWDRARYRVVVDLTAHVPADTRVRLCTLNGGTTEMSGVTGDFDVTNVNGSIALTGLRGSGRAMTVNGPVTARFDRAPKDASMFKTVNGDVIVTFPQALAATLRLKTFHGGLFTDFDVQQVAAVVSPEPERRNGRSIYRRNQYTVVQTGGGGPELTLETLNGDVRVLRAAR